MAIGSLDRYASSLKVHSHPERLKLSNIFNVLQKEGKKIDTDITPKYILENTEA
jgi:hypothetical protein